MTRTEIANERTALRQRIAALEAQLSVERERNAAIEAEVVRRGVKLSCARITLSRASLAFEDAQRRLAETQTQMLLASRSTSVSRLAACVSHELNTPLGAALSAQQTLTRAVQRLRQQGGTEASSRDAGARLLDTIHRVTGVIESSVRRADAVVARLRRFAELDGVARRRAQLRDCVEQALDVVQREPTCLVDVVCRLGDVPEITCRPADLKLAFAGLIRYCVSSLADQSTLQLETRREGDSAVVVISCGSTTDAASFERSFDPHFAITGGRIGACLELPLCARIIADHGGRVWLNVAESTPSTLQISLPLHSRDCARSAAATMTPAASPSARLEPAMNPEPTPI